jgi:hypothetical protein
LNPLLSLPPEVDGGTEEEQDLLLSLPLEADEGTEEELDPLLSFPPKAARSPTSRRRMGSSAR